MHAHTCKCTISRMQADQSFGTSETVHATMSIYMSIHMSIYISVHMPVHGSMHACTQVHPDLPTDAREGLPKVGQRSHPAHAMHTSTSTHARMRLRMYRTEACEVRDDPHGLCALGRLHVVSARLKCACMNTCVHEFVNASDACVRACVHACVRDVHGVCVTRGNDGND